MGVTICSAAVESAPARPILLGSLLTADTFTAAARSQPPPQMATAHALETFLQESRLRMRFVQDPVEWRRFVHPDDWSPDCDCEEDYAPDCDCD